MHPSKGVMRPKRQRPSQAGRWQAIVQFTREARPETFAIAAWQKILTSRQRFRPIVRRSRCRNQIRAPTQCSPPPTLVLDHSPALRSGPSQHRAKRGISTSFTRHASLVPDCLHHSADCAEYTGVSSECMPVRCWDYRCSYRWGVGSSFQPSSRCFCLACRRQWWASSWAA
jgi:hypothetical protein